MTWAAAYGAVALSVLLAPTIPMARRYAALGFMIAIILIPWVI